MINVLVLYSWENNSFLATEWAMALCKELSSYKGIRADCDMLWHPQSNTKQMIKNKIETADKIVVIVTKSYNNKIQNNIGMVSYEESIYSDLIKKATDKNRILFVLKERDIDLPRNWEGFYRIDLSYANIDEYLSNKKIVNNNIDRIILNICDLPEHEIIPPNNKKSIPHSKKVLNFEELFVSKLTTFEESLEQTVSLTDQEKSLKKHIEKSANQKSFVDEYIKAGLAGDYNLNGRMTPELFLKHFFVSRQNSIEESYRSTISDLFSSYTHNMLCIQSDGGSGKTVFLKTIAYRYAEQSKKSKYRYSNILFDFSNLNDKFVKKEDAIFQKLKKVYRRIMKDSVPGWRNSFFNRLNELRQISFPHSDLMFNLTDFENELKHAVDLLAPSDKLDDWYIGYSKRVQKVRDKADENILFILLLTFYLFALESMPTIKKENRYVIVFDNIETFDNGDMTMRISEYVQKCHGFIQKIYGELNNKDSFFTRFTFVISMRTSTFLPFGNQHTNIWGGERNIKRIKYYDFTVEALLKKIVFLTKIKDYKNTYLYKTLINVLSIMIPKSCILEAIRNGGNVPPQERYFATYRYLPLFNNNYRRAMEIICNAFTNEAISEKYNKMIDSLSGLYGSQYDYLINGIRKTIIRYVFDDLCRNSYLETIGFKSLSGEEEYSMTRMILEYLYWNEMRHMLIDPQSNYDGVEISKLIWVFKHFCSKKCMKDTLYDLSIYIKKNKDKANALYAWAYLIYYKKLDADLSEEDFKKIIDSVFDNPNAIIILNGMKFNPTQIKVKLSDAGMCFVQNYLRDAEFLMARNNDECKLGALFSLKTTESIKKYIDTVYLIIKNCIEKIILGGERVCKLYGHEKEKCIYEIKKNKYDVLECSLFIRYQECLDMIRESFDYIDHFRVSYCKRNNDMIANRLILDSLKEFYNLYTTVNDYVMNCECKNKIHEFLKIWNGSLNKKCVCIINTCENKRIERIRPIKNYYVNYNENILDLIDSFKESTELISVYDKTIQLSQKGENYE